MVCHTIADENFWIILNTILRRYFLCSADDLTHECVRLDFVDRVADPQEKSKMGSIEIENVPDEFVKERTNNPILSAYKEHKVED